MLAPSVVLLDVVETVVLLEPVRQALPRVGLAPEDLEGVFALDRADVEGPDLVEVVRQLA